MYKFVNCTICTPPPCVSKIKCLALLHTYVGKLLVLMCVVLVECISSEAKLVMFELLICVL